MPIRPFVIYVGKDALQMTQVLQTENLSFSYQI